MSDPASGLTVSEAAAILGKTPRTVRRWCQTGKLAAVKVTAPDRGQEWLIEADSVEALRSNDRAMTEGGGQPPDIGGQMTAALTALETRLSRLEGTLAGQFMTGVTEALSDLRSTCGQMTAVLTALVEENERLRQELLDQQERLREELQALHQERRPWWRRRLRRNHE